jgi:hypothetical protein
MFVLYVYSARMALSFANTRYGRVVGEITQIAHSRGGKERGTDHVLVLTIEFCQYYCVIITLRLRLCMQRCMPAYLSPSSHIGELPSNKQVAACKKTPHLKSSNHLISLALVAGLGLAANLRLSTHSARSKLLQQLRHPRLRLRNLLVNLLHRVHR